MRRKLFTLAMVVLAVLCAAACVLWVASRGRILYVEWQGRANELTFESGNGVVHVVFARDAGLYNPGGWRVASIVRSGRNWSIPGPNDWGFLFYAGMTRGRPQGNWGIGNRPIWIVWVPHWTIALATCFPWVWAGITVARRARSRQRQIAGLCPACGYDLRATPERCPECGQIPLPAPA